MIQLSMKIGIILLLCTFLKYLLLVGWVKLLLQWLLRAEFSIMPGMYGIVFTEGVLIFFKCKYMNF
jgi:hypothetical protein